MVGKPGEPTMETMKYSAWGNVWVLVNYTKVG
jgi:hypothetical protein